MDNDKPCNQTVLCFNMKTVTNTGIIIIKMRQSPFLYDVNSYACMSESLYLNDTQPSNNLVVYMVSVKK